MASMDISVRSCFLKRNEWPVMLKGKFGVIFFTCIMSFYNFLNILVLFQNIIQWSFFKSLDPYLSPPPIILLLVFHIHFLSSQCILWFFIKFFCVCHPLIFPITYYDLPALRLFFSKMERCTWEMTCLEDDELLLKWVYR